jgi:hypothetical protein
VLVDERERPHDPGGPSGEGATPSDPDYHLHTELGEETKRLATHPREEAPSTPSRPRTRPGTGRPALGGLTPQVMDALFDRGCRYLVVGFVGVDPTCDPQERLAITLLLTFLAGFRDGG